MRWGGVWVAGGGGGIAAAGMRGDLGPAGAPDRRGRKPWVPAGRPPTSRAGHVVVRRLVRQPLPPAPTKRFWPRNPGPQHPIPRPERGEPEPAAKSGAPAPDSAARTARTRPRPPSAEPRRPAVVGRGSRLRPKGGPGEARLGLDARPTTPHSQGRPAPPASWKAPGARPRGSSPPGPRNPGPGGAPAAHPELAAKSRAPAPDPAARTRPTGSGREIRGPGPRFRGQNGVRSG